MSDLEHTQEESIKYKLERLYNTNLIGRETILARQYKILYKGQIIKVHLGNISVDTLMQINKRCNNINWEDILIDYSGILAYCKESNKVYVGVDKDIARYLDKHECTDLIYRYASRTTTVPTVRGQTIKIYDAFIRKEKSIISKKDMLDLNKLINTHNESWVIKYLENLYAQEIPVEFSIMQLRKIQAQAEEHGIIFIDLVHRMKLLHMYKVSNNIELNNFMINIGVQEAKKYGVGYQETVNDNFIAYLKYLAKQEEIKGDNK